ncbi:hypothetical protein FEM48_Zijuj10G0011600 [Ziziphus jujuba var. spinosa]|uniref:DC1 domain-containing protein n=1 Tax=Ziziphus jujuba var. spinosa TaxID=714518 RepID=A0A978UKE3_ZIZJJ|nr:hypothetical protein FEM48_Zijuj10G0011600 [Ziziphus jujuba var. spinosa]
MIISTLYAASASKQEHQAFYSTVLPVISTLTFFVHESLKPGGSYFLNMSGRGCEDYYLHVGCFRVPKEMKHPLHPQHTLTLALRSIIQVGDEDKGEALTSKTYYHPSFKNRIQGGEEDTYYHPSFKHRIQGGDEEEEQKLRCGACNNIIKRNAFALNCNQCSRGGFALDMRCAFLNPTVKYDHHDHLLAHYNHIDSYTKGSEPWMRRKFIHEDEELMPDDKQLVSQLDKKIEKMRKIVKELLPEGVLGKNVTRKLDKLEESNAEAEGLIRQLRELIID